MIEEQFDRIANEYIEVERDPTMSKYELEVNWPALQLMLPPAPADILDYGAAGGVYAKKMQSAGYNVLAVDNSPEMVRQIVDVPAAIWDYRKGPLPQKYDAILAKLVVQFVEDLPGFSHIMYETLVPNGWLIVSVPHPDKSRGDADGDGHFLSKVGQSDIRVTMIHRELQDYVTALSSDFILITTDEPTNPMDPDAPSKRLNMLFRAR